MPMRKPGKPPIKKEISVNNRSKPPIHCVKLRIEAALHESGAKASLLPLCPLCLFVLVALVDRNPLRSGGKQFFLRVDRHNVSAQHSDATIWSKRDARHQAGFVFVKAFKLRH